MILVQVLGKYMIIGYLDPQGIIHIYIYRVQIVENEMSRSGSGFRVILGLWYLGVGSRVQE